MIAHTLILAAAMAAPAHKPGGILECRPTDPDGSALTAISLQRISGAAVIRFASHTAAGELTYVGPAPSGSGMNYNFKFPWPEAYDKPGVGGQMEVVLNLKREWSTFQAAITIVRNGRRHLDGVIPMTPITCENLHPAKASGGR